MRNPIAVLKSLEEKAKQKGYVFERLYRNLYNPEFYLLAYQNIAKSQGSMTAGTDGMTLNDMTVGRIERIIASLKDHSYQPHPARRQNRASEKWTAYQREGDSSMEPKKRGFQKGTHLLLAPEEQMEIRETIITRRPEEFGIPGSLWTLKKVCTYVWKRYMKSFLLGTYHSLSKKHLKSCFDEFCSRFNRRFWPLQLFPRLVCAVAASNILGYADLTR